MVVRYHRTPVYPQERSVRVFCCMSEGVSCYTAVQDPAEARRHLAAVPDMPDADYYEDFAEAACDDTDSMFEENNVVAVDFGKASAPEPEHVPFEEPPAPRLSLAVSNEVIFDEEPLPPLAALRPVEADLKVDTYEQKEQLVMVAETHEERMHSISVAERRLTEVEHLNRFRNPDGSHSEWALQGVRDNLITAVKEAAMPYAISPVYQEYRNGQFWWLDLSAVDVARSGYRFHQSAAALERVEVEVDEAIDADENLQPGYIKVFISPRMTEADAPHEVAKQEHLADDDAVRIQQLHVVDGEVVGKITTSVLIRDIPLQAWVDMLQDPENIFGHSITVDDPSSALSVMKTHRELHVPEYVLPNGLVGVLESVLPYVDETAAPEVERQVRMFRETNQGDLHEKAENIAERWLMFEKDLADSLRDGYANKAMHRFIHTLAGQWSEEVVDTLERNTDSEGRIKMTRELATLIEAGRQNTLWVAAAVITGNKRVLEQLDKATADQIYANEMRLQMAIKNGFSHDQVQAMEAANNQFIAEQGVKVGGGCSGDNDGFGGAAAAKASAGSSESGEDRASWKTKMGICKVKDCPSRPGETLVGPCGVCMGLCQKMFDKGLEPTIALFEIFQSATKKTAPSNVTPLFGEVPKFFSKAA